MAFEWISPPSPFLPSALFRLPPFFCPRGNLQPRLVRHLHRLSISILSRNHYIAKIYLNKDEVLAKIFLISLIDLNMREIMKNQDTSTSWSPSGLCCIIITSVSWCSRITLLSLGILEGFDRLFPDKIDLHEFLWFFIGCKIVMIHIRWICTRLCFEYFESVWEYPPLSRGEAHEEQGDEMLNVCCF